MSRIIKFRAWDNKRKYMIPHHQFVSYVNPTDGGGNATQLRHSEQIEVMQYTGLKDKNGVEIYEGDIVATKFDGHYIERIYWRGPPDAIAEVFWDYSGFRLRAEGKEDSRYADFWDEMRPGLVDMSLKHTKVIGNIRQTPELLAPPPEKDSQL